MHSSPGVEFILQRNALTRPLWAPFLEQAPTLTRTLTLPLPCPPSSRPSASLYLDPNSSPSPSPGPGPNPRPRPSPRPNPNTLPTLTPFLQQSAPPPNVSMLFDESMGMGATG